jgi:hypothetical protein
MIIGNSLGSALNEKLSQAMFYAILALIGMVGSLFFLGLRKPNQTNENINT